MRRWLAACLALVVAAAIALWTDEPEARVVAFETAPPVARPGESWSEATLAPVDADDPDRRTTAEAPLGVLAIAEKLPAPPPTETTRLSLRVFEPDGRAWVRGRLQLVVDDPRAGTALEPLGRRTLAGRPSLRGFENDGGLGIGNQITDWVTDGEGRAELPGIDPLRAFEVRALDELGGVGGIHAGDPLFAGEARGAELRLTSPARPVLGRCVDEHGEPLERVRVHLAHGNLRNEIWTDAAGGFATPALFGDGVELHFARRGVVGRSESVRLPILTPLEIVLERARTLTVTLVDDRGATFTLHGLQARGARHGPTVDTYPEVRDGVHVFESMPRAPVTLVIVGCGPSPTLEVDATAENVRWTLQRPGELELERGLLPPDFPGGFVIELRLPGADEPVFEQGLGLGQLQIPQRWSLFPGRYELQFHTWQGFDAAVGREPFGPPREIELRSGETLVVPLGD